MRTAIVFIAVLALVACASLADHHMEKKKVGEYGVTQVPETESKLLKYFHLFSL
jgi:hypothetical protein